MSRTLKLSILLIAIAAVTTGCYHRPYYHDRDNYGHGYNSYSSSIYLRGHVHDRRYDRAPVYARDDHRHAPAPRHQNSREVRHDDRRPNRQSRRDDDRQHGSRVLKRHRDADRKHGSRGAQSRRDNDRSGGSRVLKRQRDDDRGTRRSRSDRHEGDRGDRREHDRRQHNQRG